MGGYFSLILLSLLSSVYWTSFRCHQILLINIYFPQYEVTSDEVRLTVLRTRPAPGRMWGGQTCGVLPSQCWDDRREELHHQPVLSTQLHSLSHTQVHSTLIPVFGILTRKKYS